MAVRALVLRFPHGIAFKAMSLEYRLVWNKVLGKEQNEVIIHNLTFDEVRWVMCSTLQRDGLMPLVFKFGCTSDD